MQKFLPCAIIVLTSVSYAEKPVEISSTTLEPIVVESAYVVAADIDNTGSSVTVLTAEDFAKRHATYVADVLQTTSSIAIGATGGRGSQSSAFMRGADSNQTLVFIDGVKVNPANDGKFNFGTLPLANVKKIEILRGQQSAIWGSQAVGGVINIITRSGKNADKAVNGDFSIAGGSQQTRDIAASIYGRQGGFYYAINTSRNHSKGISALSEHRFYYRATDGTPIATGGAKEKDGFDRGSVAAKVGYDFARAGIDMLVKRRTLTTHFDSSLAQEANTNPSTKDQENTWRLHGYLGTQDDWLYQQATASYVNTKQQTVSQYPSSNRSKMLHFRYQGDINFDRSGDATQAVSAFAAYRKSALNTDKYSADKIIKTSSIGLEYRWFHSDDHALSISGRYNHNEPFDDDSNFRIAGGYRLNDYFRLHASVGNSATNPAIYDYYGYYGTYKPNPDLRPQKSRGGELGLSMQNDDESQQLDVTLFSRRTKDPISVNSDYTQSINIVGVSRAKGMELNYRGELDETLSVFTNYTLTDVEDSHGKALVRRPKHQINAGLNYRINDDWQLSGNWHYVGKRFDNYYDSKTGSHRVAMPSYQLTNIGATYRIDSHLRLALQVNNVFNQHYESVIGYGQPERAFYLSFTGQW